jgi:NAD(P)-dependent dehydrogenase (short-subunit alcohol dehydrogenase family)
MPVDYGLKGKVALVTGASAGLGEQFAHGFASSGADVVLTARRVDLLEKVASDVRSEYGVRALVVRCDVSSEDDVVAAVGSCVDEFGRVDVLMNNAGTLVAKPLVEQTLDDWRTVIDTNLTSMFLFSREAARTMISQGSGSIINIGSIFGFAATREFTEVGYYASKGAVGAMTKAMAVELGSHGVRVNAIAPGFFPTPMGADITDELRARLIEPRTCLTSRPDNSWIRGAACWLASEDACFVTGQVLAVDGGWTAF